jgi:hypothetical protein
MKRFIQSVLVLGFIAVFTGCSATGGYIGNGTQTQVQLNKANFDVIKSVNGSATASYLFGIGFASEDLFARAKTDMLKKANLHGSQALVNVTVDTVYSWFVIIRTKTVYMSADIVEFK